MTALLKDWRNGDIEAGQQLMVAAYQQLRRLAARYLQDERPDHTLQATAIVHELYLKLFSSEPVDWQNRAHFFAVAAHQIRRILVDHARGVRSQKRGGGLLKVTFSEFHGGARHLEKDVLEVDEALERLAKADPRAARIVELRFFGGLTETEITEVLEISLATYYRDWKVARAWLLSQLALPEEQKGCSGTK